MCTRVREYNEARRIPPSQLVCVECGETFWGRKDRLVCSRRCKDARYARLYPEAWREKRRRYFQRRRERAGAVSYQPAQPYTLSRDMTKARKWDCADVGKLAFTAAGR
jgi:hypothetical protein